MPAIAIRKATPNDAALILHFITELAIYEKAQHEVVATQAMIEQSLFGPDATAYALMCTVDEKPAGFAVYFFNYSTWLGKNGLYLEDLYISPEHRGLGAAKALLKYLAQLAQANHLGRFEWSVLDWNTPAIKLYEAVGAVPQNEWLGYRLSGQALKALANS